MSRLEIKYLKTIDISIVSTTHTKIMPLSVPSANISGEESHRRVFLFDEKKIFILKFYTAIALIASLVIMVPQQFSECANNTAPDYTTIRLLITTSAISVALLLPHYGCVTDTLGLCQF
ncbi:hypothetical protein ACJX0J_022682 [Zea mays]